MNPQIRAADADRSRVVAFLEAQVGAGRLTLDEFSDRVAAAYRAQTVGDLGALTADLPTPPGARTAATSRPALVPTLLAALAVTILLVSLLMVLSGLGHAGSMGPMMDHMGPMMGR